MTTLAPTPAGPTPAAPPIQSGPPPRHAEGMLLNFDSWLSSQPQETRRGIEFHLKASGPTADQEKRRLASMYSVSEQTGLDLDTVNERWDTVRGGYAEQLGGEWNNVRDDEAGFHAQLVKQATKRKEERGLLQGPDDFTAEDPASTAARVSSLQGMVTAAALRGDPYNNAWSGWQQTATGKPGFDAANLSQYEKAARGIHEEMTKRIAAVKPTVDSIMQGLRGERDGTTGAYGGVQLVDDLEKLPKEQRPLAQALIATQAEAEGEQKTRGWHAMEAIGRGSAGLMMSSARTFEASTLESADEKLAALKPGDTIPGRFENAYQFARGESADSTEAQALGFIMEPVLTDKTVTAEDIAAARARVKREQDRLQIQGQIEQVGKSLLDPIRGSNNLTDRILYPFLESVAPQIGLALLTRRIAPVGTGFTGAIASSAGAAVPMYGLMADQNAQQLMQQNQGMEVAQAYRIGRRAAYAQTGIEYAELMLGMGTLPKLGAALNTFKAAAWKTAGKALVGGLIGQNALEAAQDIMPPIAQALTSDAPGVDWNSVLTGAAPTVTPLSVTIDGKTRTVYRAAGQEFDSPEEAAKYAEENKTGGFWRDRIDTALALLPMVIFGTGGKVIEAKVGRAALEQTAATMTDLNLHTAGIPETDRAAILAQPTAEGRLNAFSDALKRSDATTAAEGRARLDAEQQAQERAFSRAMSDASVTFERGTREGAPIYRVTRGETTTEHGTAGDALAAVQGHLSTHDKETSGPLLEMLKALDRNPLSPITETSVTLAPLQTVAQFQTERADIIQNPQSTPEAKARAEAETAAMTRRMEVYEAQNPDAPIDWRAMVIGGQSEMQVKDGVAKAVLKVSHGESPYTALEEKSESEPKAWIQSGKMTWPKFERDLREIETATGDTYINGHTGGIDPKQDELALIEAYSELVQVHATGKSRAGKAAASPIAEVARMSRKGAAEGFRDVQTQAGNNARTDRTTARTNLIQAITQGKVAAELVARLQAHVAWLRAVVGKAIRLNRARRAAGGAFALDEYLNRSVGIEAEAQHAAEVVKEARRIYTPPTPEQEADGIAFRLTPIDTLDKLATAIEGRMRDPEARRKVYDQMKAAMATLRRNWSETRRTWNGTSRPIVEHRTAKELSKEQAFREAAAAADAEERIWDTLTPAAQQALGMTADDTSAYAGPLAQRFTGGRFGAKGRIQSRSAAARFAEGADFNLGGEFDGAAGLPAFFFGGSITPDNAAQEAYEAGEINEPMPDALWDAIRSELLTQSRNKDAMKSAMDGIKEAQKKARADAKQSAAAWRAEQDAMQAKDWDGRAVMLRHLRTLDALLSAMPPEVRGKVGGWTAIASLKTQPAMLKELENRLDMADRHLETAIKKDAMEAIAAVIEKASPKREGGKKPKGKIGAEAHRFIDEVERVIELTPDQVTAEIAALDAELSALPPDNAKKGQEHRTRHADIFEKQQVLAMFGALGKPKSHDAAHVTRALDLVEQVYVTGRNRWRMLEEARLEEVAGFVRLAVDSLGGISAQGILDAKDLANKPIEMLKLGTLSLKSFTETLETLFGRGHVLTARWSRAAREGMAQRTDEVIATGHEWARALRKATGKGDLAARRAAWDMGTVRNVAVTKAPTSTQTVSVPVDTIDNWTEGRADPATLGFSKAEAQELMEERAAMLEENLSVEEAGKGYPDTRDYLPLIRQTGGKVESVKLTEAEAIAVSMMWAQEGYKASLRKAGFAEDAQEAIESGLSDAAKQLRNWMATRYADGYAPLAQLFRNMFGVDLPRIENYAPGVFHNQGTGDTSLDISGSGHVEGGFHSSFLKERSEHTAEPRIENAFNLFFGHVNQTAHWKALAPLTRELRGVMGNPEFKQAVLSAHGPDMLQALNKWVESIEGNGLKVAQSKLAQFFYSMQAHVALAWKLSTILKQSTALLGAAYRMPSGEYLKGLGKLVTGRLDTATVWNSPLIQRRLDGGFSPEVRAAMAGAFTGKPTRRADFLRKGMELIGFADAFFNAGSAAIAYDYHLKQGLGAGMTQEAAAAAAMNETADMLSRTAQPVEVTDRSLFEQSLGGWGKGMFVFGSEARQKSSMWLNAWGNTFTGKATAEDYRVLVISHMIVGPLIQTITAMMRDRRDDDDAWDDEKGVLGFIDPEHWNPMDWFIAAAVGPMSGVPMLRDLVDGFSGESGPLARAPLAIMAAYKALQGPPEGEDEKLEWYGKKFSLMLQGLDSFTAVTAGLAADVVQTADNLHDDSEEAAAKELKGLQKKEKTRKDALEAARRDALTQGQRDTEDARKAKRKEQAKARELERLRRKDAAAEGG